MTVYFFDSSALVKRYVTETGSLWVRSVTAPSIRNIIFVAKITRVEMVSALMRRKRDGSLPPRTAQAARLYIERHTAREYEVLKLTDAILERAEELLDKHPLRAADAIQLASGLDVHRTLVSDNHPAPIFVSSDTRLLAAATAEGLLTHQPV